MGGPTKKAKTEATSDKTPRADRSKRLLDLVMLLLQARSPVTFRDIRDQFASYQTRNVEAGLRAFERDKADLLELGVPIRYITPDEDDALEDGGYVIDLQRLRLPEMHLTTEEVSALVLAGAVARAVPGVSYASVVDLALKRLAFDSLEAPDTPTQFPPVENRAPVLVHFPETERENALGERFSELEAATRHRKSVTVQYQSASNGHKQKRVIDPYGLVYREGTWVLVGFCHLRKDIRSFRLDRMSEVVVAPKPKSPDFERPKDFDVRAYANRSPWTFQTEPVEPVTLEIKSESAHIAREDFGAGAEVTVEASGNTLVRFPCGNPEFVVLRVLSAKGGIRVREGARLKERLREELKAISGGYVS
jgi:proteasome accessory factor B